MREGPPFKTKIIPPAPESEPTPPPAEQGPIVMVNPVLNRIAGLPEPRKVKEKAPTRRKSISEGGDVYIPKSFERIGDEVPLPAPEATPSMPETARELHAKLASTVNALEIAQDILWLKAKIPEVERQLETEHKSGRFKLSDAFRARRSVYGPKHTDAANDNIEETLEERLERYQSRLKMLNELSKPAPTLEVMPATGVASPAAAQVESAPAQPVSPLESAHDVVDLAKVRQEQTLKKLSPKNQAIFGKAAEAWTNNGKRKKGGLKKVFLSLMAGFIGFSGGLSTNESARAQDANKAPAAAERIVQKETIESKKISIDKPNEGADKMMQDFRASIQNQYPNIDTQPPIVKAVLAPQTPHMLSLAFGFVSKDGISSLRMHMGDSVQIKEGKFVFTAQGKPEHVLLAQDENGKLSDPNPLKEKLIPTYHHHLRHHHVEHHAVHKETASTQPLHADSTKVSSSYSPALSAPASAPVPTMAPREAASIPWDYTVPKPPYAAETPQTAAPVTPSAAPPAMPAVPSAPSAPAPAHEAAPAANESASEASRFNKPGATYFVTGSSESIRNSLNVDLNKVQMLKAEGKLFAHGRTTEENSEMADKRSKELLASGSKPEDTVVYFLAYPDDQKSREPVVRALFMPGPNQESQIVVPPNMPSVPKNDDYQAVQ